MVFQEGDTMNHLVFYIFTMVFQEGGFAGEGGSVAGRVGNPAGPADLTRAQGMCCLVVLVFCEVDVTGVGWLVLWMRGFIVVHCRTLWATGFSAGRWHVYRRRNVETGVYVCVFVCVCVCVCSPRLSGEPRLPRPAPTTTTTTTTTHTHTHTHTHTLTLTHSLTHSHTFKTTTTKTATTATNKNSYNDRCVHHNHNNYGNTQTP